MHPPEFFGGGVDKGFHRIGIAMVDSLSEGLAALRADRIHDLLGGLGARTIGERDMRPGTSELFANDRTDAAASSRNDRDPALECLPHHASSPCIRSEKHTSELQSLMRISYAVFCLKKQ